jgi:hypothetical protein
LRQIRLGNSIARPFVELENSLAMPAAYAAATPQRIKEVEEAINKWHPYDLGRSGTGMPGTMTSASSQLVFPTLLKHLPGPAFTFVDLGHGDGRQLVRAVVSYGALSARGVDIHEDVQGSLSEAFFTQVQTLAKKVDYPTLAQRIQVMYGQDMGDLTSAFFSDPDFPEAPVLVLLYTEGVNEDTLQTTLRRIEECPQVAVVAMIPSRANSSAFNVNNIVEDVQYAMPSFR